MGQTVPPFRISPNHRLFEVQLPSHSLEDSLRKYQWQGLCHNLKCVKSSFSSLPSLDRLGRQRDVRDDSTKILLSSSPQEGRRPLRAVLARAGMSTLWYCWYSISSIDHSIANPQRCPEGWFWRGCCGVWHASTMLVSLSSELPEEVPVDPQGTWSCPATSCWSCAPSRRCREVSSGIWFQKPGSFFQSLVNQQGPCFTTVGEDGGDKRVVQLELACEADGVALQDPV